MIAQTLHRDAASDASGGSLCARHDVDTRCTPLFDRFDLKEILSCPQNLVEIAPSRFCSSLSFSFTGKMMDDDEPPCPKSQAGGGVVVSLLVP